MPMPTALHVTQKTLWIVIKKWILWLCCICCLLAYADTRDCNNTSNELCDTDAPWPNLWSGDSTICYKDGAYSCSHDCVSKLLNIYDTEIKGLGRAIIKDSVCSTEECHRSQDFVWGCLFNDCTDGDSMKKWREKEECYTETCTEECLASFTDITLAQGCNCYKEADHSDPNTKCNVSERYIQSCYQLHARIQHPVIWPWFLLPVLVLVIVVMSVYLLKPKLFCRKRDTLDQVSKSIIWDQVEPLSKQKSKEVVLKLPYKFEHRTYTKVLKIFPSPRADVYQGEMQIHQLIGNVNKNIIAVHGEGEIRRELVEKIHNKFPRLVQQGTTLRYLMLHYCKQGSLLDVLQKRDMSLHKVLRVGVDICKALTYLQSKKIIHMDIKPANIFVTGGSRFLLGDFGMALQVKDIELDSTYRRQLELKGGTYPYYPPEYIKKGRDYVLPHAARDPMKIDIYQLGLLLWYCQRRGGALGFKRRPPYCREVEAYRAPDKRVTLETMAALFNDKPTCRPDFQEGSNQSLVDIIQSCWDPSIEDRPQVHTLQTTLKAALREERLQCNILFSQRQTVPGVASVSVSPGDSVIDLGDYANDLFSTNNYA